jgi:hypothetical protein
MPCRIPGDTAFRARLQRQYLGQRAIPLTARATLRTGSWIFTT